MTLLNSENICDFFFFELLPWTDKRLFQVLVKLKELHEKLKNPYETCAFILENQVQSAVCVCTVQCVGYFWSGSSTRGWQNEDLVASVWGDIWCLFIAVADAIKSFQTCEALFMCLSLWAVFYSSSCPGFNNLKTELNGKFQGAGAINTIPAGRNSWPCTGQPQNSHPVPESIVPTR